jgi:hypothetical protein
VFKQKLNQNQNYFNTQDMSNIIREAQPILVNNKIFSEYPMQPKSDTIVYMKPFFNKWPKYIGNGRYEIKDYENGEFNKIWTEELYMKQQIDL